MNARLRSARTLAVLLLCVTISPAQAAGARAEQFALSGKARIDAAVAHDIPVLQGGGGRFELSATLSDQTSMPAMAAPALQGGSFTLNAVATAVSLVCYNDTIFRDDFDGDGF